jgi:hypothetical protein
VRDIEVIAIGLSFEPGGTIGADAVAKSAVSSAEFSAAAGLLRKLPVTPNPVDQHTHGSLSSAGTNSNSRNAGHFVTIDT